jgi:hypothetical protein
MSEFLKKLFGGDRGRDDGGSGVSQGRDHPGGSEEGPEQFPFVIGRIALTEDQRWSIDLPRAFRLRFEDGQMVIWRPGFTIVLTVWNNDKGETKEHRLALFKQAASPDGFDRDEEQDGAFLRYSYRLDEPSDDDRVPAFYGFVFGDDGHVQSSIYFDREADLELAERLLRSIKDAPPTLGNPAVLSQMCFATDAVMEDGAELGVIYRDEPSSPHDSGWQFFTGRESQAYVDDPRNTKLYPVALVAEKHPQVIPHLDALPGSEFTRQGGRLRES